jgi:hypothetical protein
VAELDAGGPAAGPNEIGQALEVGHEGIVPDAQVAHGAAAAALHFRGFDHHQAGAACRVAASVHQVPVGGVAVDRGILVHGRDDDAIAQRERAQFERGEEQGEGHRQAASR